LKEGELKGKELLKENCSKRIAQRELLTSLRAKTLRKLKREQCESKDGDLKSYAYAVFRCSCCCLQV
jgi:hypothetical protein